MSHARERVAVLIVRGWHEGEPPTIRLRIVSRRDVERDEEESRTTASVDEASTIVRRWLEEVASRAGDGPVTWP